MPRGDFSDLDKLRMELEQAVRVRDDFLDAAAHDLRTPLTALMLQLEGLLAATSGAPPPTPEILRPRLDRMKRQLDHLVRLTDRLTDVTRAEAGDPLPLRCLPVDLVALTQRAAERLEESLAWAGCTLSLSLPARPVPVVADELRVDEVLGNLLTNAARHAHGHPVSIEVSRQDDRGVVRIADQGPGISPADRHRIFEKFERGPAPGRSGGLGLGLWISQKIVEAHGGVLRIEETPGGGATFVVDLPASGSTDEAPRTS